MKKSLITMVSLVAMGLSNSVSADSLNPRDVDPDTIPGSIGLGLTRMIDEVGVGTQIVDYADGDKEESIVLGIVTLDGAISFAALDSYSEKKNDESHQLVPFKVSYAEDGSYDLSVGIYQFENDAPIDNKKFGGWISIDDVTIGKVVRSSEDFSGRKARGHDYFDGNIRIGLLQSDSKRTNLYITVGASIGERDQTVFGTDSQRYSFEGSSTRYRYGINFDTKTKNGWVIETSVGYEETFSEGRITPQSLVNSYNASVDNYYSAEMQHVLDLDAFYQEKSDWENSRDLAELSLDSYYNQTGLRPPTFDQDFPSGPGSVRIERKTKALKPYINVLKNLDSKLAIGFRVEGNIIVDDDLSGNGHFVDLFNQETVKASVKLYY